MCTAKEKYGDGLKSNLSIRLRSRTAFVQR